MIAYNHISMFQITHYDNMYFASPTQMYIDTYGNEMISLICPKYSFGSKNSFAVCDMNITNDCVTLLRFDNYVLRYSYFENQLYTHPYKGLGLILLKSLIVDKLNKNVITPDTKFIIKTVDKNNTKLIDYYKSLSFEIIDNNQHANNVCIEITLTDFLRNDNQYAKNVCLETTINDFLNCVVNINTILPNY